MTREFPHRHNGVPDGDPSKVRGAAETEQWAITTKRLVMAVDTCELAPTERTRVLAGVIADHVCRYPNRTEAMAELVLVATRLAMGDKP